MTNAEIVLVSIADRLDALIGDTAKQSERWWRAGERRVAGELDDLLKRLCNARQLLNTTPESPR